MVDKVGKYLVYIASIVVILWVVSSIVLWAASVTNGVLLLNERLTKVEKVLMSEKALMSEPKDEGKK